MGDRKLLSQRFVDTTNKPGKYFDKNGLFLRVKEGGSKKWVFRYSLNGKRPEMGLGNAKVIKLSKAREKALQALRLLTNEQLDYIKKRLETGGMR